MKTTCEVDHNGFYAAYVALTYGKQECLARQATLIECKKLINDVLLEHLKATVDDVLDAIKELDR